MKRYSVAAVVSGPDGSGKSSLATVMVEQVLAEPAVHLHHRPGLLPRSSAAKQVNTDPHGKQPYALWKSVVKVIYVWLDYQLGWWLRLRPTLGRGGSVVIERGWVDLWVDPLRYRLAGVRGLTAVLGRLTPKPDLIVILLADAATLRARRAELSEEEISRQVGVWRRWAEGRSNVVIIDAALPQEEAVAAVRGALDHVTRGR